MYIRQYQDFEIMSEQNSSMSMNSLMEAIYGEHQTQYFIQLQDQILDQMPSFMQTLINYLTQLCVTQGFADNVERTLSPWIKQVKTNLKNPKLIIQGFLKDFLRLYEQQTQKINKYGQKKLKFLIKTVSKQIFTQIMRTACDLKLESVNRSNSLYNAHKKTNNIIILTSCMHLILSKDIKYSFSILKKSYSSAINKQQKFIANFTNSINKLDRLCIKKRKNKLWKAISLWRNISIKYSEQESILVFSSVKQFFKTTLGEIVRAWQYKPQNWLTVVIQHLSNLVRNLAGDNEGIIFEFIPNPNIQSHNSLNYSELSSYRSGISQISSIDIEQYLKNEEIKYSTTNKFLAIPIIAEQQIGLIKITWEYQLPIILFNRTLRLIELIKQIIQGYAKITTRLGYYNMQYQSSSWHQYLLELAFKQEPLDIGAFENVFCAANITLLQIYHNKSTPVFCIKYDRDNAKQIPDKIYELIWEKIQNSSNFKLDRENRNYQILKLDHQHGFCRYSFEQTDDTKNINKSAIIQCIVPLLTKNLGKIGCQHCNIKVKQLIPPLISVLQHPSKDEPLKIDYDYRLMMKLKDSLTVNQMEFSFYQLIKKCFPHKPIFARVLYCISEDKNVFAYKNLNKNSIQSVQLPKLVVNQNSFTLQSNQIDQKLIRVMRLLHSNPLFQQAELYIYQSEKRRKLRVEVKKVGRRAILIIGTYQKNMQKQLQLLLKATSGQIEQNKQVIEKKDLYGWSSEILQKKNSINTINMSFCFNSLIQSHNLYFPELMKQVFSNLPHVQSFFMWVVYNQNSTLLIGNSTEQMNSVRFPFHHLIHESIKSHQNIKGCHRVTKLSKNCGKKIQQILTYIPNWSTEQQKFKYAEIVNNYMEQVGQKTEPCFNEVSQYLRRTQKFSKAKNQFISIPVIYNKKTYILILIYNKQTFINEENFMGLQSYLRRIATEALENNYLKMRELSLCCISQFRKRNNMQFIDVKTHNRVKQIIKKYQENVIKTKIRNKKLMKVISRTEENIQYRWRKQGFEKIYRNSVQISGRYYKNSQLLAKRIKVVFAYNPFFEILNKSACYIKGMGKLQSTYKRIFKRQNCERVTKNTVFQMINLYGQGKKQIKQNRRQISLKTITQRLQSIKRRNMLELFIKNVQNLLSLKRSLRILEEQFVLIYPKNVKVCIEFIVGRLNLMLNEHYAMPVTVQLINCGFQPAQTSKILEKQNYLFVENSSFAFTITILNGKQMRSESLNVLVENTLCQILPKWQVNHRKHQIMRLRILYELLQRYRRSNMWMLFCARRSQKMRQSLQSCQTMRKKSNKQRQKMLELQYSCNTVINIQNREKHRKQIEEIKQNTNIIQNQLHRIGVDVKIKSKTNSAYRMLSILNKKTFTNKIKQIQENISPNDRSQIQDIRDNSHEDRLRHFSQAFPIWHFSLSKILKRNYKSKAHQFLHRLHNLQG